jgi:hypothetical protein
VNVLLLTSHAIAEHDDLDMFTRMAGVDCYSIGGAYDEANPFEGKRPAIPNVQRFPELEAATDAQRARLSAEYGDPGPMIDWGKAQLAPAVVDWADTVIVHHFPEQWIGGNWGALDGKRVIWRTCGQSDPRLEQSMRRWARLGMQIVRYSPREREAFTAWGAFAGEDALIRFGKDPAAWHGWHGDEAVVGNITQHMRQRGDACGFEFWDEATRGLPAMPAGPGSEALDGGIGELGFETMREYLRAVRVYLYTGTRPASYTLGLIEAMMTGTPVISIGPGAFVPSELFEPLGIMNHDTPDGARADLRYLLGDLDAARLVGEACRARAIELFGLDRVIGQWAAFLGVAA